jgi:hypothetical protein
MPPDLTGADVFTGTARGASGHSSDPHLVLELWQDGAMRLASWSALHASGVASAGLAVALAACGPPASRPPQKASHVEQWPRSGSKNTGDDPDLRLVLWHSPALGIKSLVKVRSTDGTRTLEVHRTLGASFVRYWTVRFIGDDVTVVDDAVAGRAHAGAHVAVCPRRHGRDGVVWAAMTFPDRKEFSLDFRHDGGGVDCDEFERFADRLMQLGRLRCTVRACLRPQENSAGQFECVPGSRGNECREIQDRSTSGGR